MNTILFILVVVILIVIIGYSLTRPVKKDKYNEARKLYHNLRFLQAEGEMAEYNEYVLRIIELCQQQIEEHPTDGNAYVLLANAFILASPHLDEHDYFTRLAAAVLYELEMKGYPARASKNNNQILMNGIIQSAPQIVNKLSDLHAEYLPQALDSQNLHVFSRFLGIDY